MFHFFYSYSVFERFWLSLRCFFLHVWDTTAGFWLVGAGIRHNGSPGVWILEGRVGMRNTYRIGTEFRILLE